MKKTAVIVDGGYFTKSYLRVYDEFPSGNAVWSYVKRVHSHLGSKVPGGGAEVFRVFFYDCCPLNAKIKNPIDGRERDLSTTQSFRSNQRLQSQLIRQPLICLRLGDLMPPSEGERMVCQTEKLEKTGYGKGCRRSKRSSSLYKTKRGRHADWLGHCPPRCQEVV